MTEKQKLRHYLYKEEDGDIKKAKEAYNFIVGEEEELSESATVEESGEKKVEDGIYIIYKDGHYEKFDGNNATESVKYIGVCRKGNRFAISLKNMKAKLLEERVNEEDCDSRYFLQEVFAVEDYDSKGNTERLKKQGCKISLQEGEYIPALGCVMDMCRLKEEINNVL